MSGSLTTELTPPHEAGPGRVEVAPPSVALRRSPTIGRLLARTPLRAYWRVVDRRTRRRLVFVVLASLGAALLEVAALAATVPLIGLLSEGELTDAGFVEVVVPSLGDYSRRAQTLILLAAVVGLMLVKLVASIFVRWFTIDVITKAASTATVNLFGAYLTAPIEFHAHRNSAAAARNATICMTAIFTSGVLGIATVLTEGCVLLLVGMLLVVVSPQSALTAIAFIGLAVFAFRRLFPHRNQDVARRRDEALGRVLIQLQQALGALREIRLRGQERVQLAELRRMRTLQQAFDRRLQFNTEFGRYFIEGAFFVGFGLVATVELLVGGDAAVAGLAVLLTAGFRILPSAGRLLYGISCVHQGEGHLSNVTEELDEMGIWHLDETPEVPASGVEATRLGPSAVELRNVTFRYAGSSRDAVTNISLALEPGQSLGIVGQSGSGKTTLVDLICGLLAPTAGEVIVDGQKPGPDRRLTHVGYVSQDVFLLDDTVRRNIVFSERSVDATALGMAVRLAQLDRWIESLPHGLETLVGERGSLVSGGQRQRIGLARALYRNPSLLVLDEATSALDVETEAELTAAISGLGRRLTRIVIAHRLSTVQGCDRILVLEEGRIAGLGTYAELSREHERFNRWVNLSRSAPAQ
jgi:ATP-binding cassette, subfamily B, bacterial PglK